MIESVEGPLMALNSIPILSNFNPKLMLQAESQPYSEECQIEAAHDLQAVNCWLKKHANSPKTVEAYRREALRLLLWCVYERGLPLGKLKVQDFEAYFEFLQNPPASWCTTRSNLRAGKNVNTWRPFIAGLNDTALKMAGRVLHSLMNYLVAADYLRNNPLKLVSTIKSNSTHSKERQYQVWERMLEADEWQAVQQVLNSMPEKNSVDMENKARTQLLFGLLYFLGLRIHEVANHSWNAFKMREDQWWFFVKGKGQQYAHIPVHHMLLTFVKIYRLQLGKLPLPNPEDADALFISKATRKPLSIRQLYNVVKMVGMEASKQFEKKPLKQKKLQKLSPHWLRHLFASHLAKADVPAAVIKSIMRHASSETTQLYIHTEDNLRYEEVQKIDMHVKPSMEPQDKPKPKYVVKVRLSEGSVNRLLSLERWINAIEQNVLQGYDWQWEGTGKTCFIEKLKQEIVPPKGFDFRYIVENLNKEEINRIKAQIKMESEIRLFGCEVEIEVLA